MDHVNLEVMNFLNEVSLNYPEAISFASGRPADQIFDLTSWSTARSVFTEYYAGRQALSLDSAAASLAQYGRTAGVINDLLRNHLLVDEGIQCASDDIVVTNGCQEAMLLCVLALSAEVKDLMFAFDPSYIGFTGVSAVLGKSVRMIPASSGGFDIAALAREFESEVAKGRRPRVLYVNADFNNPLGFCMPVEQRVELIGLCARYGVAILEDNPYGAFAFDGERLPTIKSLDKAGVVFYLGSFSKTLGPALRVGYVVAPPGESDLVRKITMVKSLVSVNTSQVSQAIVGGQLLACQGSLRTTSLHASEHYKSNRDMVIEILERELDDRFLWSKPNGGFFLIIAVPFDFGVPEVHDCALRFGVICMPVSFFSAYPDQWRRSIRLAFSNVSGERLRLGVQRLCDYLNTMAAQG